MIAYFGTYFGIYIAIIVILLLIRHYGLKEKKYQKKHIPIMIALFGLGLLTIYYTGVEDWTRYIEDTAYIPLLSIIMGSYLIASYEDIESMKVYDIYHILPLLFCIIYIITKTGLPSDFMSYIPLIFCIATFFSRGMADTIMMCIISIYGMIINQPVKILMCFVIGYSLQLLFCLIVCKIKGVKYKEKKFHLPFVPALYSGFALGMILL